MRFEAVSKSLTRSAAPSLFRWFDHRERHHVVLLDHICAVCNTDALRLPQIVPVLAPAPAGDRVALHQNLPGTEDANAVLPVVTDTVPVDLDIPRVVARWVVPGADEDSVVLVGVWQSPSLMNRVTAVSDRFPGAARGGARRAVNCLVCPRESTSGRASRLRRARSTHT